MHKPHRKPSPDFPLTAHPQGYFSKRILNKTHYFGTRWGDPYEALKDYEFKRPYLEAGEEPPRLGQGISLEEAFDKFLAAKKRKVESGELGNRSWDDYQKQCKAVLAVIGKYRPITSLLPSDFRRLRESFKGKPTTISNYVARSRVAFHWVERTQNVRFNFGDDFKKPSSKILRQHRNKQPKKLFAPAELNLLIESAAPQLKAMILLGVNCGLGNTDCGTLTIDRLENNWHNHPRPKTGVMRRAHLWPETVEAIASVVGDRTSGLVFITKYGNPWATDARCSPISAEFRKLARSLSISRTFYDLRRTFQTVADNSKDPVAVKAIMGARGPVHERSLSSTSSGRSVRSRIKRCASVAQRYLGLYFRSGAKLRNASFGMRY